MHLIAVKHAGVIIDIAITQHPDVWFETEGKRIRNQFPSAKFHVLDLKTEELRSEPEATKPTVKRGKAE